MTIRERNLPVSERIGQLIRNIGLKQDAVAKRAGYTPQELSNMLNGRKLIDVADIPRLANALGVAPNDLFTTKTA